MHHDRVTGAGSGNQFDGRRGEIFQIGLRKRGKRPAQNRHVVDTDGSPVGSGKGGCLVPSDCDRIEIQFTDIVGVTAPIGVTMPET